MLFSLKSIKKYWKVSLYRNAIYLSTSNGLASLLGFVFWAVAAKLYSADEVGIASAITSALGLIGAISNIGLGWGIVKFLPDDDKQASSLINTSLILCSITSVIMAGIFIIGLGIWSPELLLLKTNIFYSFLFIVFCTATALATITDYVFIAERRAGFSTARSLIFNLGKLGLVVLTAHVLHNNGIFNAWGTTLVISILLAIFLFFPLVRRNYSLFIDLKWSSISKLMRYSIPNYIATLLWSAPGWVLPLLILNALGPKANAFFFMPWTAVNAISPIFASLATSLFAEGSHNESDFDKQIRRSLIVITITLIPVILLLIFFGRYLLHIFGSEYADTATSLFIVLTLSVLPQSINQIYSSVLRVRKKLGMLIVLNVIIAVVTLLISVYLIPRVGIIGAGYGWLASQIVVTTWFIIWELRSLIYLSSPHDRKT